MPETTSHTIDIPVGRSPTSGELQKWSEVHSRLDRCYTLAKSAILLWQCLRIQSDFIGSNGLSIAAFNRQRLADLESRFIKAYREIDQIKKLVRQVDDGELGLQWASGDFNILSSSQPMGNFFIPVAIGVVVFTSLIARLFFLESEVGDVRANYNDILTKTDRTLCSDPGSKTCKNWKSTKAQKNYSEQKSFADKLKDSVAHVGGTGIGIGILAIAAFLALSIWRNK
jgi:hypothetical protein